MSSGIYLIRARHCPELFYIGSAVDLEKRWKRHRDEFRRKSHHNRNMMHFVHTHGLDALVFEVLLYVEPRELLHVEQKFLDFLQPPWNINITASSRLHSKQSIQAKIRISRASLKAKKEPIHRRYLRQTRRKR